MTLTREEIMAMSLEDVDNLIAEKVMMWEFIKPTFSGNYPEPGYWWNSHEGKPEFYFSPSSEISVALRVIEKMRQNKIYLDIRVWPNEYQVLPHQDENNNLIDRWIVKRSSLPEAIGKAALLAVLNL